MVQRAKDDIYESVKANIGYLKVFDFLGLQMKPASSPTAGAQYRGPCPVCQRGGDRILVYTINKASWCCHSPVCSPQGQRKKGGDIIGLVAHVRAIAKQSEAAKLLQDAFMREPEKPKASKSSQRRMAKPRAASKPSKVAVGGTDDLDQWEAFIGRL
jgi:hypothetical protein